MRTDLGMGKGKYVAQGAHASVSATLMCKAVKPDWFKNWDKHGMAKIAVKVQGEKELRELFAAAEDLDLPRAIIQDAGRTQLEPGTTTAVAIGPAPEVIINQITGELKLL